MAGELTTKGMHIMLRPFDEEFLLHQRIEAPLLSPRASVCYVPLYVFSTFYGYTISCHSL